MAMKLIIGLGNPGTPYEGTRHNVGFWALSTWADTHNVTFIAKTKFKAEVAETTLNDERVILARPMTYYNLVGESARAIADFYKIAPSDILVIHDDIALPLGTIRTRQGGSDGGNNGIKSIAAHLGPDTARLRIGVATDKLALMDAADFVLGRLSQDEIAKLAELHQRINEAVDHFLAGKFVITTSK